MGQVELRYCHTGPETRRHALGAGWQVPDAELLHPQAAPRARMGENKPIQEMYKREVEEGNSECGRTCGRRLTQSARFDAPRARSKIDGSTKLRLGVGMRNSSSSFMRGAACGYHQVHDDFMRSLRSTPAYDVSKRGQQTITGRVAHERNHERMFTSL